MRYSLTLMAALLATTAHADEFLVRADVTAATIFLGNVSEIERQVSVDVPEGSHDVLLAVPANAWMQAPQITGTGDARIGALQIEANHRVEEGALDTADVAEAREVIEGLEDDIEAMQDEIAEANTAVQAVALQRRYLEGVTATGDNAAPFPSDPDLLAQMLTTLGAQMTRIAEEARQAEAARDVLVEDLNEIIADLAVARTALAALMPLGEQVRVVRIPVVAGSDTTLDLTLTHFGSDANWLPETTFRLDSAAGEVTVERDIVVSHGGPELWRDVAITVSTANPYRQRQPQNIISRPARIQDPREGRVTGGIISLTDQVAGAGFAMPSPAPAVMAEAMPVVQSIGASLTYTLPDTVSLRPLETNRQAMAPLVFDVDVFNQANPRHDSTAFLMATLENDSGEPILSGVGTYYRDGELLEAGLFALLADGASIDIAFGAIDHLPLEWRDLSLDEGEEGVFSRSDTQARSVEFMVENTSDETEEIRLLYAVPFAEQEDLDVDLDLSVNPDERDVDGARGVYAWDLTLEPGTSQTIRMDVEFSWPEGQVLNWYP